MILKSSCCDINATWSEEFYQSSKFQQVCMYVCFFSMCNSMVKFQKYNGTTVGNFFGYSPQNCRWQNIFNWWNFFSNLKMNPSNQTVYLHTYNGQRHNSLAVSTQIPISLDKFYLHSCETKKTDSLEVHNTIQSSHN